VAQLKEHSSISEEKRRFRIDNNERIQQTIFNSAGEKSPGSAKLLTEKTKDVEIKLKNVYRRTSDILPLHFKSKYETIVLQDDEDQHLEENYPKDLKIPHLTSLQHRKCSLRVARELSISTLPSSIPIDSERNSNNDLPSATTTSNLNKASPFGTPKAIRVPSINCDEVRSWSGTPTSSASAKVNLPTISSPKSSFSTLGRDKASDDGFSSLVTRLKNNAIVKSKNSEDSMPTNYVNVLSNNYEPQKTKNIESIFSSASQVISKRNSLVVNKHSQFNPESFKSQTSRGSVELKLPSQVGYLTPRSKITAVQNYAEKRSKGLANMKKQITTKNILLEKLF